MVDIVSELALGMAELALIAYDLYRFFFFGM